MVLKSVYARYRLTHTSTHELRRGSRSVTTHYTAKHGGSVSLAEGDDCMHHPQHGQKSLLQRIRTQVRFHTLYGDGGGRVRLPERFLTLSFTVCISTRHYLLFSFDLNVFFALLNML